MPGEPIRTPFQVDPRLEDTTSQSRRAFLVRTSFAAGALALGPALAACGRSPSSSVDSPSPARPSPGASPADASPGAAAQGSSVPTFDPAVDRYIQEKMRAAHLPSLAAATVQGQRITAASGYGLADREAHIPADPDTVYMLASTSKTFICGALMQLWEAGSVDMDADVNSYLPFPVRNPKYPDTKITPRMLMTHVSSIEDRWGVWGTFKNPKPSGYVAGDATLPLGTWLADYLVPDGATYVAGKNFYDSEPGKGYHYSSIGPDLAAFIVESVSGQAYSDYCREHLFDPLGMTQTGLHLSDITTPNLAVPYHYEFAKGTYAPYPQYGYPDYPCGALRTSTNALSIWLRCFMNRGTYEGTRILKASTVKEIFRPQIPGNWRQGLIWYYEQKGGDLILGHSGGDYGVHTDMFFAPKRDVGIVVLSNRNIIGWKAWYPAMDINARLFDVA